MSHDNQLKLLTRILRASLARKALLDCSIMTEKRFLAPKTIDEHLSRYAGFFTRRPHGDVCFFVFVRSSPLEDYDHVFAYYVNKPFFSIPASEKNLFMGKCDKNIKQSVQMIQTEAHELFHPSVIVQMIVFTLNYHLIKGPFKKYRLLKAGAADLFICYRPVNIPVGCDPQQLDKEALDI